MEQIVNVILNTTYEQINGSAHRKYIHIYKTLFLRLVKDL